VAEIDIQQLLTRLEELLDRGWRLPLGNRVAVDEDMFYSIVEQMWISIPPEVKQAGEVQRERDRYIAQAHEEARRIIAQAREDAAKQLDEHELRNTALAQAEAILGSTKQEAARIRSGADEYAEARLRELGAYVNDLQEVIRKGLEALAHRADQADEPSGVEEEGREEEGAPSEAAPLGEEEPEEPQDPEPAAWPPPKAPKK